jgi:hypothetical protein
MSVRYIGLCDTRPRHWFEMTTTSDTATADTHTGSSSDAALLERIRKLFAKSRSTSNPHEAEVFARKAAELAARHRVDPERLRAAETNDELAIREIELGRGAYMRARLSLLIAVADNHDARIVFRATPTGTVALVAGFESDLAVIEVMYRSLHQQAASQMSTIHRSTGAATQRYRRSFLFGFAARVGQLLTEARHEAEAAMPSAADHVERGAVLVLRERADRVAEHAEQSFGRVRAARRPAAAQVQAWNAGSAAADRVDIGRTRLTGHGELGP